MMSGKAVQRTFRGHLLVSQCLTKQIIAKVIEDEPDFEILVTKIERIYTQAKAGCVDLDALLKTDCIKRISRALASKKSELSKCSETSKLWVNYLQMLGVARELVEADRTGSWQMHIHAISDCLPIFSAAGHPNYLKSAYLYLQKMVTLESDNPAVFQKFVNGFHVIRRSSLRYSFLAKKVATAKTFLTPERRTYLQVMEWLGKNDGMQPTEWGWAVQGGKLVPLMTALRQTAHSKWFTAIALQDAAQ